jgi:hypothetical protein
MPKKASITIILVPEAEAEEDEDIKNQIMKETFLGGIPFCAHIAVVEVGESTDQVGELLQREGYSEFVAKNVQYLYTV